VPRLDTGRESAKGQGLATGFPADRRARQLDLGDSPLLLRIAPQCKGHGTTAQNLIFSLASEDVLELDITQQCLSFGDEIVDHLVTSSLDDDLLGGLLWSLRGRLRLGDGKGNLAFFLLRTFVRGRSRFFDRRRHLGRRGCLDQRRLIYISAVTCRRTSSKGQGYQHQGQRGLFHHAYLLRDVSPRQALD
jgi:hypothetical protein